VLSSGGATGTVVSSGGVLTLSTGGKSLSATLSAGGAEHVLNGGTASATRIAGGTLTISSGGKVAGTETFAGTGGKLSIVEASPVKLSISGFAKGDTLDLARFGFAKSETLKYVQAASSGVLTITDGKLTAQVTLFGHYTATGFRLASADGGAGTTVTYVSATAAHGDVLAKDG
jgi:autotransporter passenger strand-loop-strand repeat protein